MNLKKHISLLIILLIGAFTTANAQRLGGGLMAGINLTTMKIADNDSTKFRAGFTGGFRIALLPTHSVFGVELDVMYSMYGHNARYSIDENNNKIMYARKSSYIEMPLLLNIYMRKWKESDESEAKMVRLRIGPQVGFCLGGSDIQKINGKTKKQEITPWEKGSYNWFHYGVTAAVSYWFIEVRYTMGLSTVLKDTTPSTNHAISIMISDIW